MLFYPYIGALQLVRKVPSERKKTPPPPKALLSKGQWPIPPRTNTRTYMQKYRVLRPNPKAPLDKRPKSLSCPIDNWEHLYGQFKWAPIPQRVLTKAYTVGVPRRFLALCMD